MKNKELKVQKSINIPAYLNELVVNDGGMVLSHFVESALVDYYNAKTKESAEITKQKQELEQELKTLESNKNQYLKEYELKKAEINFKISQLTDKEAIAIKNENINDLLNDVLMFLKTNKNSPENEYKKFAEQFLKEKDYSSILIDDVDDMIVLRNEIKPINLETLKEFLDKQG